MLKGTYPPGNLTSAVADTATLPPPCSVTQTSAAAAQVGTCFFCGGRRSFCVSVNLVTVGNQEGPPGLLLWLRWNLLNLASWKKTSMPCPENTALHLRLLML